MKKLNEQNIVLTLDKLFEIKQKQCEDLKKLYNKNITIKKRIK